MSEFQCIHVDSQDGAQVVRFRDDRIMDPERIEILGKELFSLAGADGATQRVVIDFAHVRFLSSAAINKLIVMEKRLRAKGGRVRLCRMRPSIRELFGFTHLDSLFPIDEDIADSVAALNS